MGVKIFEELSNALCLTLYIARLCSHAPKATEFSLSMLGATLSIVLGASGISNREIFRLTKNSQNNPAENPDRHVHKS